MGTDDEEPMPSVCGLKPGLFQALLQRVRRAELTEGDYSALVYLMGLAMGQEQRIEALKRASEEPHWLYKDFNVLYRVANCFVQAMHGVQDEAAQRALDGLVAQLSRLAPAFTDTEEIRAAMRGK